MPEFCFGTCNASQKRRGINIRPEIEQQREGGKDETGKGGVWFCFMGLSTLFVTFSQGWISFFEGVNS